MTRKTKFLQNSPRAESTVLCQCYGAPELFLVWDDMPKAAQREFDKNGPVPCEGSGQPGPWCKDCRFGKVHEPETE